jgi:hypothetical protein
MKIAWTRLKSHNQQSMYPYIFMGFVFAILSGCASTAVHEPNIDTHDAALKLSYCVKSSSDMNRINEALSEDANKKEFEENIKLAVLDIHEYVATNVYHSPGITITDIPACLAGDNVENPSTDFILTIELSGYGSIKKQWKTILIGTGVAEGVIQGLVVGAATQNPWLGAAVAAEEIGSEYLTWNGVDWIMGETYAPVTLEGTLLYLKDKKVLWQDSSFVTENEDELNDADKKDKAKQLRASLHKAESELINKLNKYLKTEIIQPGD